MPNADDYKLDRRAAALALACMGSVADYLRFKHAPKDLLDLVVNTMQTVAQANEVASLAIEAGEATVKYEDGSVIEIDADEVTEGGKSFLSKVVIPVALVMGWNPVSGYSPVEDQSWPQRSTSYN